MNAAAITARSALEQVIDSATSQAGLSDAFQLVAGEHAIGAIGDLDADLLWQRIASRRQAMRGFGPRASSFSPTLHRHVARVAPPARARRRPRSADQRVAAKARRRRWAGSSQLPPELREHYSEGERAVLAVVAIAAKSRSGVCALFVDAIAAAAGVCVRTVQNALAKASRLQHLWVIKRRRGPRLNASNVIRIAAPSWVKWLRGKVADTGCKSISDGKTMHPKENEPIQEAGEKKSLNGLAALDSPVEASSHWVSSVVAWWQRGATRQVDSAPQRARVLPPSPREHGDPGSGGSGIK